MYLKKFLLLSLFLLFGAGVQSVFAQSPVPQGMEDIIWQKEGLSVYSLAFSPTQPYVAVGTSSWPVLLDINTGVEIKKFICKNSITGLKFTNDGNYLFTGSYEGQFIKWNTNTWDSVIIENGYDNIFNRNAILMIDYNQESNLVATANRDSGFTIYDAETNKKIIEWTEMPITEPKYGYHASVSSVSFRNDGKVIAVGMSGIDQTWLYDIETKKIFKKIDGEDGTYSPNKNELIVKKIKEDEDGSEHLDGLDYYKFDESEIPINLNIGETVAYLTLFVFNSIGNKIIVAGSPSNKIKIYDLDVFALKYIIEEPKLGGHLSVSQDDKYLLAMSLGVLHLVDIEKYTNVIDKLIDNINIYPNPTQESIMIEYNLEKSSEIDISVSDLQGKILSNIFSGIQEQGQHNLSFSTNNLSTGSYFIIIDSNGQRKSLPFEIIR